MATFVHAPDGKWKAVIRRAGWPIVAKTFRTKRDAQDWARQAEDEMVRGIFINRADSHGKSIDDALSTYLREITPTKKPSTQYREKGRIRTLREKLKKYSLAAVTPKIVAEYRDERLAEGMSHSSVRLELALLSHLYTIAIKEWRLGLVMNPVSMIWEPNEKGEIRGYRIEKAWADVKKHAGVPDLRFHDLRHESVSRLVELGLPDQEVASISGHRSMQMLKRYTHLRAEDLVSKLDELRGLPAPKKKPRRETGTSAGRATRKRALKSRAVILRGYRKSKSARRAAGVGPADRRPRHSACVAERLAGDRNTCSRLRSCGTLYPNGYSVDS
jgi:hypothetical protein